MRKKKRVVTERRKTPIQARSRATVQAILDATADVVAEYGLDSVTTNRVAKTAGVSVGSLYQYFPGKDALIVEVLESAIERLVSVSLEEAERPVADGIEATVHRWIERMLDEGIATNWLALRPCVRTYQLGSKARLATARTRQSVERVLVREAKDMDQSQRERAAHVLVHGVGSFIHDGALNGLPPDVVREEAAKLALGYLDSIAGQKAS